MKKSLILLAALCCVVSSWARPRVPVILTAGQSNADGRVPLSDLPLLRDNLHFNAQGAQELGQRFFDKMLEL